MAVSTIDSSGLTSPLSATNLGTPSAINLSNATALAKAALPTGSVLQVVQVLYSTPMSTTSATYVSTGMSASITPSSASNKIMILAQYQVGSASSFWSYTTFYRNGTTNVSTTGSTNPVGNYNNNATDYHIPTYFGFVDSPATTSSTTYGLYAKSSTAGNQTRVHVDSMPSSLILLEIAA